ncbi:alpha-ribazole phosphatase [Leptospira santarosai]|uniref:alpha-ribazole phosphatase n=1 Tax=Leptospira santarosai TaxID=28183 RepID=UPI0002BA0779|nr:alpha-ribazole phosphatase [Leptospira santarosai]ASV11942.1 alpha-ribazole phosphatase [Leptospira santarosai]EMF92583.1 alpha-ribazole phosphatase [Leptospira santarosai str. ST188]MBW9230927.1 alpha-ribazole phosphatase [Leptospira santarosai]MDO6382412.1 alpha-ribazole phosphatase [Leptospira santarosai]OLY62158.1 alpha-ribazole phosphatase [Leptospira santarosai serovar Guaricura]
MELYLIRHTTPNVPRGTCYGRTDVSLAEDFYYEFCSVLEKLDVTFDRLYSSPSSRCRNLVEFLKQKNNTKLEYSNLLMELDFGEWEGELWSEIPEEESNFWTKNFVNARTPGGENYSELYERVERFLEKILSSFSNEKIGIVTHAGVIRAVLCKLLEIPLERGFFFDLKYGSLSKILVEKKGERFFSQLIFWNL